MKLNSLIVIGVFLLIASGIGEFKWYQAIISGFILFCGVILELKNNK